MHFADLQRLDICPSRGFLPMEDPLEQLPDYFWHWESGARELPKLLMSGEVRKYLGGIPRLDTSLLQTQRSVERAMLILSYFGHAWVWGEREPSDRVPANIAVPWYEVASRLGRPPILSYASHALSNWRRLDPTRGIELGNIVRLCNFLGGLDEEWFVLIHISIEANAGPALQAGIELQRCIAHSDPHGAINRLETIADVVRKMRSILSRMPENCDPYIYYRRVRPFIFGWEGNPAVPEGVIYEGVVAWAEAPKKFRGETGAQSSIIPSLDAVLGIRLHGNEKFAEHLLALRDYMPVRHREFVETLERRESELGCRDFVARHQTAFPSLADAYNTALEEMHGFRSLHLRLAGSYIAQQEPHAMSNPTGTGTGGTPFMAYLQDHAEQTLAHKV